MAPTAASIAASSTAYSRSLGLAEAMREDVLLAYAMNGAPLLPQHGAPLRLVVPRWYGMASVKWLRAHRSHRPRHSTACSRRCSYHFRAAAGRPGRALHAHARELPDGAARAFRTSSAAGAPWRRARWRSSAAPGRATGEVRRVEFSVDGAWQDAALEAPAAPHAWRRWSARWQAARGAHELRCRATDATGAVQPLEPPWDVTGFGNNAAQRVEVTVR